jgi:3-hydroxyacyl-CoA dehydrogenase
MIARGQLGEKSGKGFYERRKGAGGESEIWTLDCQSLEYRPRLAAKIGSIEAGKSIDDLAERVRMLFHAKDKAGDFLRATLAPTLVYTARVTPDIAHSIDDVDRVMRWGFGWELGPFETWDALGIRDVLKAIGVREAPPLVADILQRGSNGFRGGPVPPATPDLQILRSANERERVLRRNAGASLVDLGDGVLAVDFHSKMNAIGGDTVAMLDAGLQEAEKNFAALVVGSEATDFSVGANLMLVLLEAQEGNWDEIDLMVRTLQRTTQRLRYASVPVVVCPAGMTLGGGCEILLHGDRVQAAAESYIGLVEVGVGLIPAGGGTKEMLARATGASTRPQDDLLDLVQPVFETIGFAKVSGSAAHARQLGFLTDADGVTMNRERLISDAKAVALARARNGYRPPPKRTSIPVGGETILAALNLGVHLAWRAGRIGDHDAVVGRALARILAGGALPHRTTVSEDYLLDLEREAFVRLCGERKTLERIQYTLKTGKTLRN